MRAMSAVRDPDLLRMSLASRGAMLNGIFRTKTLLPGTVIRSLCLRLACMPTTTKKRFGRTSAASVWSHHKLQKGGGTLHGRRTRELAQSRERS